KLTMRRRPRNLAACSTNAASSCDQPSSARLPPAILHRDPMKVQWKKQSGPLLVSSCNLVSAKTRKRGADDDQSDPHRRVYRSDHAVPVPRLRAGEQRVEARVHDRARGPATNRITGLLATQGIGLPPGTDIGAAAKTVRLWDASMWLATWRFERPESW